MARPTLARIVLATLSLGVGLGVGCYRGFDVEDKQPPPGYPGGKCQNDLCLAGVAECYVPENVCLDPYDPCKGIYCAGYGTCGVDLDTNLPFCQCDPGYTNDPYAYYCIPMGL